MKKYVFSRLERWAVYETYDAHCYMCRRPLAFTEMHVDHVVPEHLLSDPAALNTVLTALGLPSGFAINDFGNWLPSCSPCNREKADRPFEPVPVVLLQLAKAKKRAERARRLVARHLTDRRIDAALVIVEAAVDADDLEADRLQPLIQLFLDRHPDAVRAMQAQRDTDSRDALQFIQLKPVLELRLTPFARAVYSDGRALIMSASPLREAPEPCARCGSLGPFSGIRCLNCGFMDDGS